MRTVAVLQGLLLRCLLLTFVAHKSCVQGKSHLLSATEGANITLQCKNEKVGDHGARLYWYKQSLGTKPKEMSSFLKYDEMSGMIGEFRRSERFRLDNDGGKNDLYISDVVVSDSAVYHCLQTFLHYIEFLESVTVIVSSQGVQVVQPPHVDAEEGRSVILKCSVHSESCGEPPRVHWFKPSEESAAGVLYSPRGGPTDSCDYTLPLHNVSSEQTGTYYCAVAACGHVLFGNGTKVEKKDADLVVYVLGGALVLAAVLVVGLALALCRMRRNLRSVSSELQRQATTVSLSRGEADFSPFDQNPTQEVDSLHYAALSINSSRRQRVTEETDCVYSSVNQG